MRRIGEIAQHTLGKMLDKSKNKGEPRPYWRKFLPEEVARYSAEKGDVLVCEGGYPGRAAIWEGDEPILIQKAVHRVRFHEPERNRWFLYYLLNKDLDGTLKAYR